MSEISESLHIWRASAADVRELARRARTSGRIVASNERWTTFVPLEDEDTEVVVASASHLTLHWTYFADFGLALRFFEKGRELGSVRLAWSSREPRPSEALTRRLRDLDVCESLDDLATLAAGVPRLSDPVVVRDAAAAALGLPAYEWLSPRYCRDMHLEDMRQAYPNADDVTFE